ncbi:hypothetical protein [Malacoplasma iowae]|uniref:hypothetical protein n=1 Tax=Malacoplasma iowae TaxID=2116 RepID=UPI002A189205|nr:hypothetical protein [Malacoplasma iowae]WPL38185.1 hypothetical protein QX182_01525 [Malacoplasma iowae]
MLLFENIKNFFKRPSTKDVENKENNNDQVEAKEDVNVKDTKEDNKSNQTTKSSKSKKSNSNKDENLKEEKTNDEVKEPTSSEVNSENGNNVSLPNNLEFKDEHDKKTIKERILSVDRFKGFCMFMLALSIIVPLFGHNLFVGDFGTFLGSLFKHAPNDGSDSKGALIILPGVNTPGINGSANIPGVSFADLFAPMFIFAIGLTIIPSFRSRERKYGTLRAYLQLATRFLALIGLGSVINGLEDGWIDVWTDPAKHSFEKFSIQIKIYAVSFWIVLGLMVLSFASVFIKTDKYKIKTIMANGTKWYAAIMGLFSLYFILVKTGETFTTPTTPLYGGWVWDTLQNIGLSGLFALPFIALSKWARLITILFIIAIMSVLYQNGLFAFAKKILEGGVVGAIMWAMILLFGSVYYELREHKSYWVICSVLMFLSLFFVVGLNFYAAKRGGTPMYALFTASLSAMIWGIFNLFNNFKPKYDLFADWGANSIFTYITLKLVRFALEGGIGEASLNKVSAGAAIPIIIALMGAFTAIHWVLRYKKVYIKL